jgi:hypothetical protein
MQVNLYRITRRHIPEDAMRTSDPTQYRMTLIRWYRCHLQDNFVVWKCWVLEYQDDFTVVAAKKLYLLYPATHSEAGHWESVGQWDPHSRLRRPRRLRYELSSPARTFGSWFQIPLKAWMSVSVYSVCVVLCVGSGLATGWSPAQGVLHTAYKIKKLRKRSGPNKGLWYPDCRCSYDMSACIINV